MDQCEDRPTPGEGDLSDGVSPTPLTTIELQASLDVDTVSLNGHSNHGPTSSPAIDATTMATEFALIAKAKQKRLETFNVEYLCTSAGSASIPTPSTSPPAPQILPITIEYASMVLGHPFKVSRCRTLQALKLSARVKCTQYNAAAITDATLVKNVKNFDIDSLAATLAEHRESQRQQLLDLFGYVEPADASTDEGTRLRAPAIDPPFGVFIGVNIRIGREFYGNAGVRIHDHAPVVIGDHVRLGPNVSLLTECHPIDAEERRRGDVYAKPIEIGDDVWIGAGATVLGGVKIGNRAIVAAGALVNRDVGEGELVAGVPARAVRKKTGTTVDVDGDVMAGVA